ncbi:MAG TPA: M56 family metallopeptidase [Candidatus Rubrimentiphilum sp.]|nr:M56 family metallopeptidase [Candidatus Rubrimentiphilum sp.]
MNAPALLMALFNGAWQGTVLCLGAFVLLARFRKLNAATRYAIWSGLLGIALLLPFANYAFSVQPVTHVVKVQAQPKAEIFRLGRLSPPSLLGQVNRSGGDTQPSRKATWFAVTAQPTLYERAMSDAARLATYAQYALYALLLIALVRLAFLVREVVTMIAARRSVRPIDAPFELHDSVHRAYEFAASPGFAMPCVLGFQPALIVIPEALLETGSDKELLSVVLHEHEHVMRFDDVQNVLHRLAGALGFFLPGVRIALRELAICREQVCDDAAIAGMGNRYAYARTLSAMAGWIEASAVPVPCFIFKRKQLLRRIEVLLDAAVSHSLRPNARFAVSAVGALVLVAALVLRFQVPVFAERIAVEAPPKPAVAAVHPAPVAPAIAPRVVVVRALKAVAAKCPLKPVRCPVKAKLARIPIPAKPPKPPKPKLASIVRKNLLTIVSVDGRATIASTSSSSYSSSSAIAPVAYAYAVTSSIGAATPKAAPAPRPHIWAIRDHVTPLPWRHPGTDLLDALSQAGYNNLSVDDLIRLRDHGVSGSLITGANSFFGHPSPNDLVMLADHGVSGSYLAELRAAGMPKFSAQDVIRLRDHGVSMMLISGLRARGYALNVDDLVRLADHGVGIMYIETVQRIRANGHPSIDDIIRLHDAGFTP